MREITYEELMSSKDAMNKAVRDYDDKYYRYFVQALEKSGFDKQVVVLTLKNKKVKGVIEVNPEKKDFEFHPLTKEGLVSKNSKYVYGLSVSSWEEHKLKHLTRHLKSFFELE